MFQDILISSRSSINVIVFGGENKGQALSDLQGGM